jgi:nitrogen fixation protein
LQPVVEKRDRIRGSYISQKDTETPVIPVETTPNYTSTVVSATETVVSVAEMPQRKVKETKVKEIKENTQVPACVPFSFLDVFWNRYPKQKNQLQTEDIFFRLTNEEKNEMLAKLPQWMKYWSTIEVRYVPAPDKFLGEKQWRDEIPKVYQSKTIPAVVSQKQPEVVSRGKEDHPAIWQYFM